MNRDEIANVWEAAADYIEEHGWHQGDYESAQGAVCALGALNRVLDVDPFDADYRTKTDPAIWALTDFIDDLVSDWNDDSERTKEEVADTLRRLAKELREG